MQYAYLEDGKWIGPVALRSRFRDVGGWHTLTDEQRAAHRWYPLVIENDAFDPRKQTRSPLKNWRLVNGVVYAEYDVFNKSLQQIISERCTQVNTLAEQKMWNNVPYTFPGDDVEDAIQFRNPTDRSNIESVVMEAQIKLLESNNDPIVFMPMSNNVKHMSAHDVLQMGIHVKHEKTKVYEAVWAHKQTLRSFTSIDDVLAYNIEDNWT